MRKINKNLRWITQKCDLWYLEENKLMMNNAENKNYDTLKDNKSMMN